ncbi:N-6 DNA methylase [Pseudomonas sp. RA_5y_Pfl1_P24]|uniref:N-6 DNA methylase n=1 Tax=Pseudomonas sp. RA_5y_Pfl1_P24 TaxID=3088706 RepID=UPI0030D96501
MQNVAHQLVSKVISASEAASNEAQLRHELESALKIACEAKGIPWTPFQLERALKETGKSTKFADVAHGAVVIEYEPPKSFAGRFNSKAKHARSQAEEYAVLISAEEGRVLEEYVLVIWDGLHINFGRFEGGAPHWDRVIDFDINAANCLLAFLERDGRPLVHPQLLQTLVGPDSDYGVSLIPALYESVCRAESISRTSKTNMLFTEWRRLFSQVVGFQPANMKALLARQEISHDQPYEENPAAYLFALNTYIAIIAKVVTACTLPSPSQNVLDSSVPVFDRLRVIETGELFEHSGILNMLSGDFFDWYLDDCAWPRFSSSLEALLGALAGVDFTIAKKNPNTTRDLFKGIYERFIPREVRHALGEFYTPDWLAEHGMDLVQWGIGDSLTDPTCGSGTFLLEALRRRLLQTDGRNTAHSLLNGLHGIDLNPLAVLAAKGSLAIFLSPFLDPSDPIRLPVYLADAINPARVSSGLFPSYSYIMQTEVGPKEFSVPENMIRHEDFFKIFTKIRGLIDADVSAAGIKSAVRSDLNSMRLDGHDIQTVEATIENLVSLHDQGWNGIWCAILADRFAAGAIPPSSHVCGNPPWVKWSNLPKEYAKAIQAQCKQLGVFSKDKWVGGIEADISTVVTYQAIYHYLAPLGRLGFFLPGSVFTTPSSAGFRKFSVGPDKLSCKVLLVEDFDAISPFDGVTNMPRFLVLQRDAQTVFPVPYRIWTAAEGLASTLRRSKTAQDFRQAANQINHTAVPVPGDEGGGPWLIGSDEEQAVFAKVFAGAERLYTARKGVTADRNGVFWVYERARINYSVVKIQNAAAIGKTKGIPEVTALIESEHLFPLLRGKGVKAFCAIPDEKLRIIVPQRGMHGDPDLKTNARLTYRFLRRFETQLLARGSYKKFQKKEAFYSLWNMGAYTFSPYKVLWREIGRVFAAAYIGSAKTEYAGEKLVIPDHKLYFIPVETEGEAAYLTGFLNAPVISGTISAYASKLSLGVSVTKYINIPLYDESNFQVRAIRDLSLEITNKSVGASKSQLQALDIYVKKLLNF